jgi:PAS domain S-box-containing protein
MTMKNRNSLSWALLSVGLLLVIAIATFTVQMREQQRLALGQAMLIAAAIAESDTATIAATSNGIITDWNKAAEEMTGYRQEEAVGWGLNFLIPEKYQASHHRGIEEAAKREGLSKPVQIVRCSILHKKGHEVPVVFSLRRIPAGSTRYVVQMDRAKDVLEIEMKN